MNALEAHKNVGEGFMPSRKRAGVNPAPTTGVFTVKSRKRLFFVIPAQAGIQSFQVLLDSRSPTTTFGDRLRGSDGLVDFYEAARIGSKSLF